MKTYTVERLAELAGVSVRTLHHYDAIGLLRPALVGGNGYRYYGRNELLRLQQILILRELDLPLQAIAAMLDRPDYDRLQALREQRRQLQARARHYRELVDTIDRTIADIQGDKPMSDEALYRGVVAPEKQAGYEQWLEQRYGPDSRPAIVDGRRRWQAMDDAGVAAHMHELEAIESGLAKAMRRGVAPASAELDALLGQHHTWVAQSWGEPPSATAYAGLADLYLSHPDFVDRYEGIAVGFADYLTCAMKAWAGRSAPDRQSGAAGPSEPAGSAGSDLGGRAGDKLPS